MTYRITPTSVTLKGTLDVAEKNMSYRPTNDVYTGIEKTYMAITRAQQ